MAGFLLGFLWLCSPKVGEAREMYFISLTRAILFFKLLISVVNKILRRLAGPAGGSNKNQDWYPKEPVGSMISVGYSGENMCPNGRHALADFCYVASAGLLRQNGFRP